ncbi:MAG: hypothetical protein ABFS10_02195 [Bacteroidota bacterium]
MGIPRFIKLPGHKRFDYSPRYWDPEKEEREERIRQIKQEMGVDTSSSSTRTRTTIKRGSFRQTRQKTKVKASRDSNIRLVIILAVLLLIAYFLFLR